MTCEFCWYWKQFVRYRKHSLCLRKHFLFLSWSYLNRLKRTIITNNYQNLKWLLDREVKWIIRIGSLFLVCLQIHYSVTTVGPVCWCCYFGPCSSQTWRKPDVRLTRKSWLKLRMTSWHPQMSRVSNLLVSIGYL